MSRLYDRAIKQSTACHMRAAESYDVLHRYTEADTDAYAATPSQTTRNGIQTMTDHLEAVVTDDACRFTLRRLESTIPNRLHVQYIATSSDDDSFILTLVSTSARLLRFECHSIRSEAMLLRWLSAYKPCLPSHKKHFASGNMETVIKPGSGNESSSGYFEALRGFVPRIVKQGHTISPAGIEYLLTKRVRGSSISTLRHPLSEKHREAVNFQIGQLIHRISVYQSPCGRFGMTSAVLGFDHAHNNATSHRETSLHANNGVHNTWSEAFLSLLESVLRDAEDATISIQYERLRRHAGRFKHVLDEVKIPSLVIVDAGQDFNTLVGLPDHIEGWEMKGFAQRDDGIDWTSQQRHPATSSPSMPEPSGCSPVSGNNGKEELEHDTIPTPTLDIVSVPAVVGIQDWHNSVFGDPYFASVLSQDDNADVWAGLVYQFECSQSTGLCQILCWEKDSLHAQVRRLLYESYHAVVAIVTEFYRIEADSDDRELPARKRLLQALAKLDDIDGFGEDKYPRSDSIMSSAKRRRLE